MEARITYFEKPGKVNTDTVIEIVKKRSQELGVRTVVVASSHGSTAEKAIRALGGMKIVVVGGFQEPTMQNLAGCFAEGNEKFIKENASVLIVTHLFAGISRAMRKKYNSSSPEEIAAQTLRTISVGIKVAIECAILAADAGLVSTEEDVIAIGGTGGGADTAIVVRPVNSQDFFDLKVKEILCKPRVW